MTSAPLSASAKSGVIALFMLSLMSSFTPAVKAQTIAQTPAGWNCESMSDDFQVRWKINGGNIDIELVAEIPDNSYMAFGVSGSSDRTNMIGADVVVADIPANGNPRARDFYMDNRSPCNGGVGVCPDDQSGFSNDVSNVSGEKAEGLTLVRYTRPLNPGDGGTTTSRNLPVDKAIATAGETFIAWALGPINAQSGQPGFHGLGFAKQDGNDVALEFGRAVADNCVPLVEIEEQGPPPPFARRFVGDQEQWIDAHIGPAGGPRGYSAIRDGVDSFGGLAWYLNGVLIPELVLRRGTTYRFRVNGGEPHPFYLTDSPTGGYRQKTPAERAAETVFAGVTPTWWDNQGGVTEFTADGVGPICRYQETAGTASKELASFDEYVNTLDTSCASDAWLLGQAGTFDFTPDQWTPDELYYQCVTHANLGFKVTVIDQWDPAFTSNPTAAPTEPPTASPVAPPVDNGNGGGGAVQLPEDGFALLELEGQLEGSTLFFKFNPADPNANGQDTISVIYEAPVLAWAAVGFSDNGGFMIGSEAVIGLPDTGEVLKYNLNAKNGAGVVPMPDDQQTLIDTSIVQNDETTVLTFTKILNEPGEIAIGLEDDNTFLSAWGLANNLGIHAARGSYTLAGKALEGAPDVQNLWIVHGWLAAFAWAGLSPLAILSSILRQFLPMPGLWFQIHRALNLMVVTFTIAAFIIAVIAIQQTTPDGQKAGHFDKSTANGHRTIGLVIFILAFLQGLGGILRPHAPEKPKNADGTEKVDAAPVRTKGRFVWEIGHRAVGLGLLGLCWYQVKLGIQAYVDAFNGGDGDNILIAIYAIFGIFGSIMLVGYVLKVVTAVRSPSPPASPKNINENGGDDESGPTSVGEEYKREERAKPSRKHQQKDMDQFVHPSNVNHDPEEHLEPAVAPDRPLKRQGSSGLVSFRDSRMTSMAGR